MTSNLNYPFLKKVKICNFKSFDETEIDLDRFNVIIGPNAAGKTNFTQIFSFLKDICNHGLDNAISIQGGIEHVRNIKVGNSKNLSIEISGLLSKFSKSSMRMRLFLSPTINNINYRFSLKFNSKKGYKISEDRIIIEMAIESIKHRKFYTGTITITNTHGTLSSYVDFPEEIKQQVSKKISNYIKYHKLGSKELLLESWFVLRFLQNDWMDFTDYISIYDFDPKLPKKAIPIRGEYMLESDGSNIALILQTLLCSAENKRKFLNLLKELLPFVDSIDTQKFADKFLLFKIKENYFKNHYLPSSLLSDGTINITSLIVALYFEDNNFVIIEEPERNIHPSLLSNLVGIMKEASETKQVILTTHNPELVKHAGIENLLTISRTEEGFSKIERPADKSKIQQFLSNELELSDLYTSNILTE